MKKKEIFLGGKKQKPDLENQIGLYCSLGASVR
jgi:hypothetical protein